MTSAIDLHVHTAASDGAYTPTEIVQMAERLGIQVMAITDHDTVAGVPEALAAAGSSGVEVIPGVEISAEHDGVQTHILGLYVDHTKRAFVDELEQFAAARLQRAHRILERLQAMGIPLPEDSLYDGPSGGAVGRPHIARLLVQEGHVASIEEAFGRYLNQGQEAYVPRAKVSPTKAIRMIHQASGIAVLAHPWCVLFLLDELVATGLDGLEVFYRDYDSCQQGRLSRLAHEHGLICSGGSDFHGLGREVTPLGGVDVPATCVTSLQARRVQA